MKKFDLISHDVQSLQHFALLQGIAKSAFQKALKQKDVRVNGVRIQKDCVLQIGDLVTIFLPDFDIQTVFESDEVLIINKPRELAVCDSAVSLQTLLSDSYGEVFPIHRLDRNTSGLVLFARNELAMAQLKIAFTGGKIHKFYTCIVCGIPKKDAQLQAYLEKDAKYALVIVKSHPFAQAKVIRTNFEVMESNQKEQLSLLRVQLLTGRTHQIRAHLSFEGYPILGDDKYGDREQNKRFGLGNQALCATELWFNDDAKLPEGLAGRHFRIQPNFPEKIACYFSI